MRVLFVCTGNTCRSPMAEGIFRFMAMKKGLVEYKCGSAGICARDGAEAAENAVEACSEIGVDISAHRSRQINGQLVKDADLIVVMMPGHAAALEELGLSCGDVRVLNVPDPFGGNMDVYRTCRDSISDAVNRLLDELEAEKGD